MHILLATETDTRFFARTLALAVQHSNPGVILLYGDLGVGKTTLARYFVESLPGGAAAEIASPSFTICNIYCTKPVVHHFDLYRIAPGIMDEALEESLDTPSVLTLVEWSERLTTKDLPTDGIQCRISFSQAQGIRQAQCDALGSLGNICLNRLATYYARTFHE